MSCAAVAALVVTGLVGAPTAAVAAGSITIADPGLAPAGTVQLSGSVSEGPPFEATSVLYVVDASDSTKSPGNGCGAEILTCELAGVRALNNQLATSAIEKLQVGFIAFADLAGAADINPDPAVSATFAPPGGDTPSRLDAVMGSVEQGGNNKNATIGLFEPRDLGDSGTGTAFNNAVDKVLEIFGSVPTGSKNVMFLTDGNAPIADDRLSRLAASGVRWRSFEIGPNADCDPQKALAKLASVTGEGCVKVTDPSTLSSEITQSQPDTIFGPVTVSIGDVTLSHEAGPLGAWGPVAFTLGAGTHTATATAKLRSGATVTTSRSFTVQGAPGGPPPGSVAPGPGSLLATKVVVTRPSPAKAALPSRVTGSVGLAGKTFKTSRLNGSRVRLEGRASNGATWVSLDTDKVEKGAYVLKWKPKRAVKQLRVSLAPYAGLAGSATAVPAAKVSACVTKRTSSKWSMTCNTTAKNGKRVVVTDDGRVVDRAKVKSGHITVHAKGRPAGHVLVVKVKGPNIKLRL